MVRPRQHQDASGVPRLRLVTVDEAACYLGMKRRKLYDLIASGKIASVLIPPRMRRLDIRDLDRFIDENRQDSA